MKTQKPEKRIQRKSNSEEYFDYDEFQKKSKAKKPKRGRKEQYDEDGDDLYDDDSY